MEMLIYTSSHINDHGILPSYINIFYSNLVFILDLTEMDHVLEKDPD